MKINAVNNNQPSFGMAVQLSRQMRSTLKSLQKVQNVEGAYDILNYLNKNLPDFDFRFLRRGKLFPKGVMVDIFTKAKIGDDGSILEQAKNIGRLPTSIPQMRKNPQSIIGRIGSLIELRRYNDKHAPARFFDNMKDFIDRSFGDIPTSWNRTGKMGNRTFY